MDRINLSGFINLKKAYQPKEGEIKHYKDGDYKFVDGHWKKQVGLNSKSLLKKDTFLEYQEAQSFSPEGFKYSRRPKELIKIKFISPEIIVYDSIEEDGKSHVTTQMPLNKFLEGNIEKISEEREKEIKLKNNKFTLGKIQKEEFLKNKREELKKIKENYSFENVETKSSKEEIEKFFKNLKIGSFLVLNKSISTSGFRSRGILGKIPLLYRQNNNDIYEFEDKEGNSYGLHIEDIRDLIYENRIKLIKI